ncbi:zinc-dependent alcohol dehydrogenase [Paenibacillus koleovorans]|uniref:zinc-dependent alcohol dehydrogenase n=1 Tax=Paenibacillus koleovorans TaxID=121608 RepID=UPI000FD7CD2E|nr:zinc-binding alcohol dehydrogenase [Paenibacillus koleovorans]
MKALTVVFTDKERVAVVEEHVGPVGPDEVLCRARKSLISTGTETLCLRGVFDPGTVWADWVQYPFYPGYGMAAEVLEVGSEVQGLKPGDRVYSHASHQQYHVIKAAHVTPIPEHIADEEAAWSSLINTTQLGVRRAELKLGETVGVIGMGLLGQLVVQYLRLSGCRYVVAIDPAEARLKTAEQFGATHGLAMDATAAREEVRRITEGKMLDVVFDITGHPAVLAPATRLAGQLGRVVLLGDSTVPSQQVLGPRVVADSISVLGTHAGLARGFQGWDGTRMTSLFFDFLQSGRMDVKSLITHRHSPANAVQVYEGLLRDRSSALGVIFDWDLLG